MIMLNVVSAAALRGLSLLTGAVLADGGSFWMPQNASTVAGDVDWLYWVITYVSLFFLVLITALMLYFMWKYRRRPGHAEEESADHNLPLEIFWSVIPLGLVVWFFVAGFRGYMHMMTPPTNAMEIQVLGQKWNWQFTYPNGAVDGNLHAPVNTNVRLVTTSQDVIHSLYIPAFRIKRDVVPGRFHKMWFNATQTGEFQIFCAEYCGTSHSNMLAKAIIHPPGEFEKWAEEAANFVDKMKPEDAGQRLYLQRGCAQCHSIDGKIVIGPSFKGLFGSQQALLDGSSVEADENYIRESILEPQAKVVKGFAPVMPTFKGRIKDKEIGAIIAYMKTLK